MMMPILGIFFWMGVIVAVREWIYARRHKVPISLIDKLLVTLALPIGLAAQLAVEEAGFRPYSGSIVAIVAGVALNGWVLMRRIQRKAS